MEAYYQVFRDVLDIGNKEEIEHASIGETDEWDSFAHFEMITRLEDAYHIQFTGEDVINFKSFESGVCLLRDKGIF